MNRRFFFFNDTATTEIYTPHIVGSVWGIDFEGESRTLDMHIKTLRQKLKEEGSLIKTVRNVGYIMNGEKA